MTDGLTGLLNHRAFQERLGEEMQRAHRHGTALSLIMADVDHFKHYNDDHGHQAGDRMLREVAQALTEIARSYDSVARYGGEEFAVILPGSDAESATAIAERMRMRVARLHRGGFNVTASFGVGSFSPGAPTQEALIAHADKALFASKQRGRDRVTHASTLVGG
jgi:diguanylate cyclase (GGDEF)-like protein